MATVTRAEVLSVNGIVKRLKAAAYPRQQPARASGFYVEAARDGSGIEVWHLDARSRVIPAGPPMGEWGRRLAAGGLTVHVVQGTHLLVTLPAAPAAPHAVERAA